MLVAYRRVQHNSAEPSLAQHPGCLPGAAGHAQTELRAPIPGKPSTSTLHTFCCLVSSTPDRSVIVTEEESCCHSVQPNSLAEHNAGVQCLPLLPECAVMAVNVLYVIHHCHRNCHCNLPSTTDIAIRCFECTSYVHCKGLFMSAM